ncbi:MAG TPA: PIG-L family deacetylase, partial [Gemmatimonadales bacterium]|nr:PIG-L family deacetylase [Gemmatimonadales bacterium]
MPVGLQLRRLDGVKRVLMIAAHPDDEDTSLLATLARGWGAETAYLSLTRGDGGQNAIGSELWEGLGVVRTGELVAARRLDGAEQFFTRAFDYGFSKNADEAFANWPREELLADVVWVIRSYRPQVIVSVWSGTPRDGHGQHQASGIIAQEAFRAAGDSTRFPEQLELGVEAWAPAKLYESARGGGRGGAPPEGALRVETGQLDPL